MKIRDWIYRNAMVIATIFFGIAVFVFMLISIFVRLRGAA